MKKESRYLVASAGPIISVTRMYIFPNRLCKKRLEASLDPVAGANMHTSTNCALGS